MKSKLVCLFTLSAIAPCFAGESYQTQASTTSSYQPAPMSMSLYNAGEWQIDLFGSYSFVESGNHRLMDDDTAGGGVAINYFFTQHFGIGIEGQLFDTEGDMLGSGAVDLIWRFPIADTGWAPYIYGGAGITFNADDIDSQDFRDAEDRLEDDDEVRRGDDVIFLAHGGAGIEYRFTPHTSIFADARYTWSEKDDSDFGSARAGLRFSF